jgi:hypothetical protein
MTTYDPKHIGLRVTLIAPFVLVSGAAVVLIVAAMQSFGAAQEFGYPDAVPPIGGVIFATPVLVCSAWVGWQVWRRTKSPYQLEARRLVIGVAPVFIYLTLLLTYAGTIGDSDSYRGAFNQVTGRWDPQFSVKAFILLQVGISLVIPFALFALMVIALYLGSIRIPGLDVPAGPDPIGQLLAESHPRPVKREDDA